MTDQAEPHREISGNRALTGLWAFAVLAVACGFVLMVWGWPAELPDWLLRPLALSLAGLVAILIAVQWTGQAAAMRFQAMFGNSPVAACLTDSAGRVLALNTSLLHRTATARPEAICTVLGHFDEDGDRLGQNLMRRAWGERHAGAVTGLGLDVTVERCGAGQLLWRFANPAAQAGQPAVVSDAQPALRELPVALVQMLQDGTITFATGAAQALLGLNDLAGRNVCDILEGMGRQMRDRLSEAVAGPPKARTEMARILVGGREVFVQANLMRLPRSPRGMVMLVLSDATEFRALEAQFVQSQKMQAVGQLAGGVAHDFNNLLTAINGHCDLLLLRHGRGDASHADLEQIRQNAQRAAALVRQLLAFSRKQTLQPRVVDLAETLGSLAQLLDRLVSEKVHLSIRTAPDLPLVRVDERQFEQVIMNLVVNARDAMPFGGEVTISGRMEVLERDVERDHATIPAGPYAVIDVTDTGTGMSEEQMPKIFEPFYTTKRLGEGTGLGLSTAYGIIKQTGGFIFATSRIGEGSTFTLYLPANAGGPAAAEDGRGAAQIASLADGQGGDGPCRGRILLAEDEAPVRSFAARALRMRGYVVAEADSGEAALALLADPDFAVDLLLSDVVMPGLDGPSWVRLALQTRPEARVIFTSGYAEDTFHNGGPNVPGAAFLPKPFSLSELTQVVKAQMPAIPA